MVIIGNIFFKNAAGYYSVIELIAKGYVEQSLVSLGSDVTALIFPQQETWQ